MKFPSSASRESQYFTAGLIMADTALGIGLPLQSHQQLSWAQTMERLALADDASETNPNQISTEFVLRMLGLEPACADLNGAVSNLIQANKESHEAETIEEHFKSKGREAHHSLGILRYQLPAEVSGRHEPLWQQLSRVAQSGMFVDSFIDSLDDAQHFSQFSALELSLGSLRSFMQVSKGIHSQTWVSLLRSAHAYGLDVHVLKKPLRILGNKRHNQAAFK